MNKLFLTLLLLLPLTGLQAQSDATPREGALRNMISVAPINSNLFGTSNAIYYKRLFNQKGPYNIYYRAGLGVLNRFTADEDTDRRAYNLNFGLEWYRPLGDFSITFGPELGYTRASFAEESISMAQGRVFSLPVLTRQRNSGLEKSFYRSYNLAWFVGLRYHIGPHFQFGIESALGWSFYRIEEQSRGFTDFEATGTIRELVLARHFVLEVNF